MKYLRPALGVLLGLYVLLDLYHLVLTVGHKTGTLAAVPADAVRVVPLMDALAWWQLAIWAVAIAAYAVAAWRLLRGGKALMPFAVGFVVGLAGWLTARSLDAYSQVFTAQEQQMDYYILGALVVALLLTWWTERTAPATAAAA